MPSFPLTPALSPGERENLRQRVRKPSVSGMLGRRSARLPLPKGEGWGEGEGRNRPAIPREDELCSPQTTFQILVALGALTRRGVTHSTVESQRLNTCVLSCNAFASAARVLDFPLSLQSNSICKQTGAR